MDKQAEARSNPIVYDFSHKSTSWTSEEGTEEATSFHPFLRAETPPEYRDEPMELTDVEETDSANVMEGSPQSQTDNYVHGDSSKELTDSPIGIQECSQQISMGDSDHSPENTSADSPETSPVLELADNPLDAQECSLQLETNNTAEDRDYILVENESLTHQTNSPQMLELTGNPLDVQECNSPQLEAEPNNKAEDSDYTPGEDEFLTHQTNSPQMLELAGNPLDAQECSSPQLKAEPNNTAEISDYTPGEDESLTHQTSSPTTLQMLELTGNPLDVQECSSQLEAEPNNTAEVSYYSPGEKSSTFPADSPEPSHTHSLSDNQPEIRECSQQLSHFREDDPTQISQDSSQKHDRPAGNLVDLPPNNELYDNDSNIQECSQRLNDLLDNSSVIQECNVIPDEPADKLQSPSPPQVHDSPNTTTNVQEDREEPKEKPPPQNLGLESRDEPMEQIQPSDQTLEQQPMTETESSQTVNTDQLDSQAQNGSPRPTQGEGITSELMDQQTTGLSKHEEVVITDSVVLAEQHKQQQQRQNKKENLQPRIKSTTESLLSHPPPAAPITIMQDHMTNEEYRCWKDVLEHPEDFDTWVKLLALSEKHENIIVIREIFDRFLKLYPYCYGYWRKLSDLVLRLQGWSTAQQILEIAVYSIPLSIDLWLHYAMLSINQGLDYSTITGLYDRSLEIAGYEYRSDLLWEAAIQYQENQNQPVKVFTLLRQLIATPTQQYKNHFTMYETFLSTRPIRDILSAEELKSIGEQIKHTLLEETSKSLEEKVRDSLLDQGTQVHAATEEEISLRHPFEEKIKRPYFHVQPLEEAQLQTWRSYLDFEISRKYKDRTVFLFERCMIVCALYEEMWIKYAKYLGFEYSQEARAVFQRGTCYIPKSVPIHLEWSYFEENLAQLDSARELLESIDQKVPGLVEIKSHYISFELRHGNKDRVDEQYKLMLQESQKQYQKNSQAENKRLLRDTYNYWAAKYAFFLSRHRNEHKAARKLLSDAIEKDKNNQTLYFHLADLELHQQPLDKDKVMSILNKGIHAPIPQEVKDIFSLRKYNWSQVMGIQLDYRVMNELKTLYDKSIKQAAYHQSPHAMRKRPSDYESDIYAKQARLDPTLYTGEQAQYSVNYAQNQQTYSQYYSAPTPTNQYQYQASGQRGDVGNAGNQQWGQQYNYQQDWGYHNHQYQHQ